MKFYFIFLLIFSSHFFSLEVLAFSELKTQNFVDRQEFILLPAAQINLEDLSEDQFINRVHQLAPEADPQVVKEQFVEFYKEFLKIIEERRLSNPYIHFSIENGKKTTSLGTEISLKIESLYQRPDNDSNNWIEAYFYLPKTSQDCLNDKIPGTVILQHIRDRIDLERRLSKFMTNLNNHNEQSFFVFTFPQYGKRKNKQGGFFTSDLKDLRSNFLQTLLDIHVAYSFLAAHPYIDPHKINLYGTSLGAILGYLASGVNPIFDSYSFLAGGGNLYKILTSRMLNKPKSDLSAIVKDLKNVKNLQNEVVFMDPILWSSFLKNKRIQILHAERDELIDYKDSMEPLLENYRSQNNNLTYISLNLGHGVSLGLKALFQIFFPIKSFLATGVRTCHDTGP